MFYEENEISELLRCPYCKNKYHDPRLIECGSSFCMPCIELLTKSDTNGFQCPVCDEFHEQPKKSYLKNTNLAKLCEKRANKVSRSPLADTFEGQLDELKSNMNKLAKENDKGADKIEEHCDELKNEVQLHLEESIESLKNQSLELIQKIDEYKNEAALKFDTNHNLRLETFLIETRQFHEKWSDYLKQFEIDDEELRLASNEAKNLQNKIKKESAQLLSNILNSSVLKFKKSTPIFGSLVIDDNKQSYIQALNSNSMKSYNLSNTLYNISKVSFKLLSNGNLCIAYQKNNNVKFGKGGAYEKTINLVVYDKNFNQLFLKPSMFNVYQGIQLVELNETIILCMFELEPSANNFSSSSIIKYDFKLNVINECGVNFEIIHANAHEDKLFLLATSSDRESKHIYVYDESLNLLENIQLENSEDLPFCIPNSVTKMRVTDSYFIFLGGKNVLPTDRYDGMIKRTFSIGSSDFVLDLFIHFFYFFKK